MVTDEQLIQRLRSGMESAASGVTPPYERLDGVSPSSRRSFRLPRLGVFVPALASVSAIAVVAAAIILLGHRRPVAPEPVVPAHPPVATASTLAELRSELAILRRPQRAADKLSRSEIAAEQQQTCSDCMNVASLIAGDTRLLATIRIPHSGPGPGPGPERVYLVIGTVPKVWGNGRLSGWRQKGRAIEGIHLTLAGFTHEPSPGRQPVDDVLNPAALRTPAQTLTPRAVLITGWATVGVVPDGVTRVKWELDNPGQRRPVTVYPRVRGNVAIAPWTPAPRSTALVNEQLLAGATWYGPGGRVIASFSVSTATIDRTHSP